MKIIFVVEDQHDSVDIQVMRFDASPLTESAKQTPANQIAQEMERLLMDSVSTVRGKPEAGESCLH